MTRDDRNKLIAEITKGVLVMILISIMGWLFLTFPEPTHAPRLEADKGEIIRLTGPAMAEATAAYNAKMEARAKK